MRASSCRASAGLPPSDEHPGQGHDGAGVVGLELERPAQRRLVARLDQGVGLRGRRGQAVHELGLTWASGTAPMNPSTT